MHTFASVKGAVKIIYNYVKKQIKVFALSNYSNIFLFSKVCDKKYLLAKLMLL